MSFTIHRGDALDLMSTIEKVDLIVTDPPYAFGGSGEEHAISATVAIVLREAARKLKPGGWMIIYCASSWRSAMYMAEAVRGIVEPVRFGTWVKPKARSKTRTPGWAWTSVKVIACRNGKSADISPSDELDWIMCEPVTKGRRAQLPAEVAMWSVRPFAVPGGTMLDPFAGSGAILKAASECGMNAIGFEKDPIEDAA